MKLGIVSLSGFAFTALTLSAHAEYRILEHYKIGGDASGFDYVRADPVGRRLYVAHEKRFEVLDLDSGSKVGEIAPTARAHGTAIVSELNRGFATSGIDDQITVFDLKNLSVTKRIKSTGSNPDAIEYDPESKRVYVANHGSGEVTVIDPATMEIVATIALGGKLEGLAFDGRGQGYVLAEDKSAVHVFDTRIQKGKATWSLGPGDGGTGLAADAKNHRLFAACANNLVIVLESDTGKLIAKPGIGDDPDGLAFDAKTRRIFTSNSDGTLSIIQQKSADEYSALATVKTAPGCRTVGFDEKTGRVFTCAPQYGPKPAAVAGGPRPRAPVIPGTFEIFVIGE